MTAIAPSTPDGNIAARPSSRATRNAENVE